MLTRRQRHDGGDGDDEHHSVTVQHRGPSAQSSAVDGQAVRPNDDSRPQASAPDGGLGGRAPGAKRQAVALPPQLFAAGYLATGTALALMGQVVTNQGAAHPSSQLVAWTRYLCTFVLSLAVQFASRPKQPDVMGRKATLLVFAVGAMDVVAYTLNCLGFAMCGAALSMVVFAACGQVFTALTRLLVLRRAMTRGQYCGVGIVVAGLVVRSLNKLVGGGAAASAAAAGQGSQAAGVAFIVASALCYSMLGVLYEWLTVVQGPSLSHARVSTVTSLIGLLATSAYQVLYTAPRWQELVEDRMQQRGLQAWDVIRLYVAFGALFTVHSLVQGKVLQRSGAMAVGIVSALRAAVVSVASGLLFCSPAAPQQCLTPYSGGSAAIVTAGALLWTLTGPPKQQQQQQHTQLLRVGKEGGHVGQGRAGDDDHDKTS